MLSKLLTDPTMTLFFSITFFLFGLCVGSFLNVCIFRIPRGESVVFIQSHCLSCGRRIRWHENIPVLSWVILRGKCGGCGSRISLQYPLVELITGILLCYDYMRIVDAGLPIAMLLQFFSATCLIVTTFMIDFRHRIIPDKITYSVMLCSLLIAGIFPDSVGNTTHLAGLLNSASGIVAGFSVGGSISIIGLMVYKKEVFGWGDVKFMAATGACFGFIPPVWFFVIFAGSLLGVFAGIILMASGRKKLGSLIVFGPFLSIAAYLWIICGPELVSWYFRFTKELLCK